MSSINIIVQCYPVAMLLLQGETIKKKKKTDGEIEEQADV